MTWTRPAIARLRSAVERGETDAQIAATLGTNAEQVRGARRRYGIPSNAPPPPGPDPDALRAMIEAGATDTACAATLGVSHTTVGKYRRAMNITRPVRVGRGVKTLSDDQIDAIRLAVQCGWSQRRIIAELHVGIKRIRRIMETQCTAT